MRIQQNLFQLYSTLLPELRATNEPAAGAALRELDPSEDRSEMPPSKWLDIEYHYRFTGSSQDNLPKLFLAGWTRSAPFVAVIYRTYRGKNISLSSTDGLRAPAVSLPPLFYQGARKLMLFAVGYWVFKEHKGKNPLIRGRDKITDFYWIFRKNFLFLSWSSISASSKFLV